MPNPDTGQLCAYPVVPPLGIRPDCLLSHFYQQQGFNEVLFVLKKNILYVIFNIKHFVNTCMFIFLLICLFLVYGV